MSIDNTDQDDPLDALTAAYQAEAQAQNAALLTRLRRAGHKKDQLSLRQQGLSTSLIPQKQHQDAQPSKGLALLKKMGYQEGKGLGSQLQGRSEPIPLVIRSKRSGLGIHEAKEQQQQQAEEREVQEQAKRQRLDQAATEGHFAQRVKSEFQLRKLLRQLREAWQAAESLEEQQANKDPHLQEKDDMGAGLCGNAQGSSSPTVLSEGGTVPDTTFLTPFKRLNMLLTRHPQLQQLLAQVCPAAFKQSDMQQENIKVQNALTGDSLKQHNNAAQLHVSKLDPAVIESELQTLLTFLRDCHRYCLFCGCAFDSQEDLQGNCPGQCEADHE